MNCSVNKMDNSSTNDQQEIYRSKSARHCISTLENIRSLQLRKKFCDITINVRGEHYFAHRVVLVAASQHFADVLDGEASEPVVVDFNHMSSTVFEILLEYVYSGNSNLVTSDNMVDLFKASKILRIGTLEAACSEALPFVLTPSNWCKLKAIAGEHHSEEVFEKCQAYAWQHFAEIAESDAFLELPLDEVKQLVANSGVVILSEEETYSAVLKWVKHDLENRTQNLFELMKDIKFPLMDKTFFIETVMRESLLRIDLDCTNLLLEANEFLAEVQLDAASTRTVPQEHLKKQLVSYIFATGHYNDGCQLSDCEVYNPRTRKWYPIASMQSARCAHAVVGFGQLLYAFGGYNEDFLSTVEYYNPMKDVWAWTTPMPNERRGHGVCVLNGSIFICGGLNGNGEYLRTVEQFDPSTTLYKTCVEMNTERTFLKVAAIGDCIYAIGGENAQQLDLVERFDPREGRWSAVPSMSSRRTLLGVTVLNGYIYCTGGSCGDEVMASGERFDIRRNTWESIPNMLTKRSAHEMVTLDGCIYAIGGYTNTSHEMFDPDTNRWAEMPSMLATRYYFGASTLDCIEINHD